MKEKRANDGLEAELREMRSIRDRLREEGILLRLQSAEKDRQVLRLEMRLDAVLYAMVLMQAQVQAFVKRDQEAREKFLRDGQDSLTLAT